MKYEKGFKQQQAKSAFSYCPRVPSHAPFQIVITLLSLTASIFSFICVAVLQGNIQHLSDNFQGALTTAELPCLRRTLDTCNAATTAVCRQECCPEGYQCVRDPTVGMYCQDTAIACGSFDYCLDLANLPGTCERATCQSRMYVKTMVSVVYLLATAGVALDLFDILWCFALADCVMVKSIANMVASLVKFLAFGGLMGVGTEGFILDTTSAKCYNVDGTLVLQQAYQMFAIGATCLFCSAVLTLVLVPISALHGGRLADKPHHHMKVMDLGG